MPKPTQNETQLGLAYLKKRFSSAGLPIVKQLGNTGLQRSTYLVVGTAERQTDITIPDSFLDDLPNTTEYQSKVESYASVVASRIKCASPELFYCRSGIPVSISIVWPIQSGVMNSEFKTFVLMNVVNQADGHIARCSMETGSWFNRTIFDFLPLTINSVRSAVDEGAINFLNTEVRQEIYQRIMNRQEFKKLSPNEVEMFVAGKAYFLGFLTSDEPSAIWAADPWDAQYLGITRKELQLTARIMRANGLMDDPGLGPEYGRPTDKLLAQQSVEYQAEEKFDAQQQVSRHNLPNKEALLSDMKTVLERHSVSALLVIDLDHFKNVNDAKGHSEGDACLQRVVMTISTIVGRKGRIYRWGGDEFAVCLPDFSSEEAQATAERIRLSVEQSKPGGEIAVTTSIGICGADRTDSKLPIEILDLADKAMYESKRLGKNRITTWPFAPADNPITKSDAKRTKESDT
jgi:diguanylate cyclase (GGDEF)-like protein